MWNIFSKDSIKNRILSGFLFLIIFFLLLISIALYFLNRSVSIANIDRNISKLQIFTLSLFKNDNDFFDLETINENYFRTAQSNYLLRRDSINKIIKSEIEALLLENRLADSEVHTSLMSIDSAVKIYNARFSKLEELIWRKGFKDFGVEGQMRFHAHELEKREMQVDYVDLLLLRRNEKDFLLRLDKQYLTNFDVSALRLLKKIEKQSVKNVAAAEHLKHYHDNFKELAWIIKQIGLNSNEGLRNDLNLLTEYISSEYLILSQHSYQLSLRAQNQARVLFAMLFVTAFVFSIISAV
ncbi:hypothetical protein [Chryseosolibacter indicus]|uniref:Uncharacterized protein n=1 Tax=Chryseosolibacter indicus TaxID=2782351 RepID=A0ABS5VXG4_9BACT|nr:hypothetical protein [Chryseosolibacter indicus]MBT1705584.1 hypothetical protein [Chryseosolibacter indicus]